MISIWPSDSFHPLPTGGGRFNWGDHGCFIDAIRFQARARPNRVAKQPLFLDNKDGGNFQILFSLLCKIKTGLKHLFFSS